MKTENESNQTGFAGFLARTFLNSHLTPVIILSTILLGLIAVMVTPKEEEPQISVPMIDIRIDAPGFEAAEVERKITEIVERSLWGLEGVEYIYSASSPHSSLITVRFKVNEPMEPSLLKVHHKIMLIKQELPRNALEPRINAFSIDDVPFLVLTFSSDKRDDYALRTLTAPFARQISATPDLSRVEMLGGRKRAIRVTLEPSRASALGVNLTDVSAALLASDVSLPVGKNWSRENVLDVEMGGRLASELDVLNTTIGQRDGRVVRLRDIATVSMGAEERSRVSVLIDRDLPGERAAVSISFAKRKGTNAVTLSDDLLTRAGEFSGQLPPDVKMSVIRNYGETARTKSNELIKHLLLATGSVAILIALAMGLRASLVVAIAIPVTLALTLAIYYIMGYSLNRVTLFALIFSIGILVDDAIVVVENIERHLRAGSESNLIQATLRAVAEVGNPTILATFTVIAAILPMAFVRGLMGPYMKPIPVGASLAMILSLLVAFVVTPWASVRLLKGHASKSGHSSGKANESGDSRLDRLYRRWTESFLGSRKRSIGFAGVTMGLLLISMGFVYFKIVKVKMLPFDNKNEFQITLDFPGSTPLSTTRLKSTELAHQLMQVPEIESIQVFAGESAPFSFSGMVKHTFLRQADYMSDLHVVLKDKEHRKRASHEIIESTRPTIQAFAASNGIVSKVLEIPPGPPVLATMVAEVYGPDPVQRQAAAQVIRETFQSEPSVVDLDHSWRQHRRRLIYEFDPVRGGILGIRPAQAALAGRMLFSNQSVISLSDVSFPEDVTVDVAVPDMIRSGTTPLSGITLSSQESGSAQLGQVVRPAQTFDSKTLYRKNLRSVDYVMSELSGSEESPVYAILKLAPKITIPSFTADFPTNQSSPIMKWDGEWHITYEVFRDLGSAFAVVIVLIYILVLGWFRSYTLPLIIMAPIPISLIGILPGHAALGAYFTATSMIGFIAGAGIIVRNSIILVDFIEQRIVEGVALKEAVVMAGILRFRPMLLTAAAVVVGSSVMLFDPIFQGLAISLMFGEIAATLISRFAVPLLYYWFMGERRSAQLIGG
ncbi:MAG: efflux RND transporter permease subunit [Spirochaetia bacterium]|nr:efflux RND transporter permease subunit [Spirochaetia bacterium]